MVPPAENIGEMWAVLRALKNPGDLKPPVTLSTFTWAEDCQEPELGTILRAEFWNRPEYAALRDRLLRPAPSIKVVEGGKFVTITTSNIGSNDGGVSEVPCLALPSACAGILCLILHGCTATGIVHGV